MKRAILALVVSLAVFPAYAREPRVDDLRTATPEELAMTSVPYAEGASAVVLDWVQWHDDVDLKQSQYMRIKILTNEGRKYADVEIPYIPLITNLEKVEARMTKPDGTIVPFNGKIYEKLIVRANGVRVISKTFTLPDVQPGCIIEYRYVLGSRAYDLLPSTKFKVQRDLPIVREVLWFRPWKGMHSLFSYRGLPPGQKPEWTDNNHYQLTIEKIPAFRSEPNAPPAGEIQPVVNFWYSSEALDVDAFWKDFGKSLTTTVESFISGDPSPIHNAAAEAVKDAKTADEKLRRLYALTQKVRNLSYEKEKSGAELKKMEDNSSAQDVLRNNYGYAEEITRLFVALARSAGFEASSVRVGTRDDSFFWKKLPIGSQLDGEVAVVKTDAGELVLDPGTPNAPYGVVAWWKGHVPGLRVAKKQEAVWFETPELRSQDAVVSRKATLHVDDDALKGKITVTYAGQQALVRRIAHQTDDEAATKKALEESMKSHLPDGAKVTLVSITGMKNAEPEVVVQYDVEVPGAASSTGSRMIIPISFFRQKEKNPFTSAERRTPVYFEYPAVEEDDVTLELPAGYAIESLPGEAPIDGGSIGFSAKTVSQHGAVHFTRRFVIDSMFFPRDQYKAVQAVFARVTSADQEQVVLKAAK